MNRSPQIQSRINDVAKALTAGKERAEILRKYAKKWQIAERTIDRYLKPAKEIAKKLSNKANKAAEDVYVSETVEAAKSGLKSKFDRVMILQGQCSQIENELIANVSTDYIVISGKLQRVVKEIPVTDRAYLRKTLKDLQAEISKIEGDYAAVKNAFTDKDGNDIKVTLNLG